MRSRRAAFIGSFCALFCAAVVVSACGLLLETGLRGAVATERYAGADAVVTADQNIHWVTEKHGKEKDKSKPLAERVWLDESIWSRVAALDGVARVVREVTFPARAFAHGGRPLNRDPGIEQLGHGWGSASLTPYAIRDGRAPRAPDEIVLDFAAADRAGISPGSAVMVQSTGAPARYRVVGLAEPDGVNPAHQTNLFFDDEEARRLAGHDGQVTALGVMAEPRVAATTLTQSIDHALSGTGVKVRSGSDRGVAEFPDAAAGRVTLMSIGGALAGTALLVALLVVVGTVALATDQRRHEIAVLRVLGASPRQVQRLVAHELVLVSLIAAVPGATLGLFVGRVLYDQLVDHGSMPATIERSGTPVVVLAAAVLVMLGTWIAARIGGRRTARIPPAEALTDAAIGPPYASRGRLVLGVAAAVGCAGLVLALRGLDTEPAAMPVTMLVPIVGAIAVALLGPVVIATVSSVSGFLMQGVCRRVGPLARINAHVHRSRLAGIVTPMTLAIAMTLTIVCSTLTLDAAAAAQVRDGTRAGSTIVSDGDGVPRAAAERVHEVSDRAAVTEIDHSTVWIGRDRYPAQGVTPGPATRRVLDLGVVAGDLGGFKDGTLGLSEHAAAGHGVRVGDRVEVTLGDGAKTSATLAFTYTRRLGFGDVTLPFDLLHHHVDHPLADAVLVRGPMRSAALRRAIDGFPMLHVVDAHRAEAMRAEQHNEDAQARWLAIALVIAFTAIALVNTIAMMISMRTGELTVLRLNGATRSQVRHELYLEVGFATITAVGIATAIAVATVGSFSHGLTGRTAPVIPPLVYGGVVSTAVVLALLTTMTSARIVMRQPLIAA